MTREWKRCDCGQMRWCRWDGAGWACKDCDAYVALIHRIIDLNRLEHDRQLHPDKPDRSEYFREWRRKNRQHYNEYQRLYMQGYHRNAMHIARIPVPL